MESQSIVGQCPGLLPEAVTVCMLLKPVPSHQRSGGPGWARELTRHHTPPGSCTGGVPCAAHEQQLVMFQ